MGGVLEFLGMVRNATWIYLCVMFLAAAFFLVRERKRHETPAETPAEVHEESRERGAA